MKTVGLIVFFVCVIIAVVLFATWVLTLWWAWIVPDVFAGAVAQGLLPATLTLLQAFKLSILCVVLFGAGSVKVSKSSR